MSDYGLVLYGNAIMVNPDFAKANPKVVQGFVRATIKGVIDTIKDPDRRHQVGDEAQRHRRREDRARPPEDVDPRQLRHRRGSRPTASAASTWIAWRSRSPRSRLTYDFKNRPKAADIFTAEFLPPAAERKF